MKIEVDRPDDFDEFWAAGLAECARHPLDVTLTPMRSTGSVATYDLHYTSYKGIRVAGWYTVPRDLPEPLPALITIPGYISEPVIPRAWSERGYAALAVAPRGKLRSNSVFNPGYPGLLTHNIVDHHTYGYRGFYLDVVRAVDVLLERPEVDSTRIGLEGSSQGGGLGISTAALRPEAVACVAAGAPYLCGIMTAPTLTRSYPYEEINEYLRIHPDHADLVRDAVAYYDGLNFAPLVEAPTMIYLGLEDDVCPPETGFALHEALPGEKRLHTFPHCAHNAGLPGVMRIVEAFLAEHLKPNHRRSFVTNPAPSGRHDHLTAHPKGAGFVTNERLEDYWQRIDDDLARVPARPVLELVPSRTTDENTFFDVRLTSTGPYRIFGYLSVPKGRGPFPALLQTPRHGSVNHVPHPNDRRRYVVFAVMHRGQRRADDEFAAPYPGLLTMNIDDPTSYVYRGIAADCLRAAEFLVGLPDVDTTRVGVNGDDLALITAARRPVFSVVQLHDLLFYRALDNPVGELADHLPASVAALEYFDPVRHAPDVSALTQIATADPVWCQPLVDALPDAEVYQLTHQDGTDHDATDAWLADRLGTVPMSRFRR